MADETYVNRKDLNREPLFQGKGPLLVHLDCELTERCNNSCQHCYINLPARDAKSQKHELNTEQWQKILREAADLGAMTVRFTGGEPLLREDFAELYLYTRRLGLSVKIFTNARCITPALADLFARVPPREKIEITVYGMRPETYDVVACAPGAYQEFRRGVDLLLERRVPFIVKGALLPQNKADVKAFEAWAATIPWMEDTPSYAIFFNLRGRHDSAARNHRIERLRISAEEGVRLMTLRETDYRKGMRKFCSLFIGPSGDRLFTCGAGKEGSVDAYGFYQPCLLLRDPTLCYDLRAGSLRDALEHFFPRLRERKATNPLYLERCARCFLHGLCEQCPAHSWVEHGVLDAPVEYRCEIAHAQARFLGLLSEGEKAWQVTDWQERLRRLEPEPGGSE